MTVYVDREQSAVPVATTWKDSTGRTWTSNGANVAVITETTVDTGSSWRQLSDILQEAQDLVADQLSSPPVACPNDGTPLVEHRGRLVCPFDGWKWRGHSSLIG